MAPNDYPTAVDVLRLKNLAIEKFGGAPGDRPPDNDCIEGVLGAALQAAYYTSEGYNIDPLHIAAYLLYYIARNHCFFDGNKRAAWMTATDYLLRLGLEVVAGQEEVVQLVERIATGQFAKEDVVEWLAKPGRLMPVSSQ